MLDSSPTYPTQELERFFTKEFGDWDYNFCALNTQELHSKQRQNKLFASEKITLWVVMEAKDGVMANKYVEGCPGRRYCGGFDISDVVEVQTIIRAKNCSAAHLSTCNRIPALSASGSIRGA